MRWRFLRALVAAAGLALACGSFELSDPVPAPLEHEGKRRYGGRLYHCR